MIKYHRDILSLYVKPSEGSLKNIVNRVTWRWTATDESDYADMYIDTLFNDVNPKSFIDYQTLTEDIVFSWIDSVENITDLKSKLDQKLLEMKNPVMVEKLIPWQKTYKYTGEEEYLLVFDDQPNDPLKIWGPMRWNSERANDGLRKRNVHDYEFPTDVIMYQKELLPFDAPMIVNGRVKLYRVEYTKQPDLDERYQYHDGLTWVTSSGKAVGTYFVHDNTVEKVKEILQINLSNVSFEKQTSGVEIQFKNSPLHMNTDIVSRISLMQNWLVMKDSDTIKHKINANTWVELTKSDTKNLIDLMHDHINSILNWEKSKFDEINACKTVNELKLIEV